MNWWSILEISRDSDLKTIKKSYAKLLKIYNPEDDAEGYQNLREAYDMAVKYAKKNQKTQEVFDHKGNKSENDENEDIQNNFSIDSGSDNTNLEVEENKNHEQIKFKSNLDINQIYYEEKDTKINLNEQIDQFFNRLNEIYSDFYLRTDLAVWDELLNSDVIWNVNSFPIIEDEMFNFLIKYKYLPPEIWIKLDNNFTWSKNQRKLYDKYSVSIVDEFLKNLKEPNNLKYDYIRSINSEIADEYLFERQQADEALKDKKYAKAYNHLKNANSLFSEDAELLRLTGDYHYEFKAIEKALEYYKSAFEMNNNDLDSALNIGIILVTYERFSEAIPYLKAYLSYNNNDKLALNYSAYCYYYNDDLTMAQENFQKLLCFEVKSRTIQKYLKNIEKQLREKHVRKIKFDKENLILEEVVKKEAKTKEIYNEKPSLNIISIIRGIICVMMLIGALGHMSEHNNQAESNYNKANKSYEDKIKGNSNNIRFENISTPEQFINTKFNMNIKIYLFKVKSIKYYKISEPFENRVIFSESELDRKGLRDKVESQMYIGTLKQHVFIFSDPKCNSKTIDKNGGYEIKGSKCDININIENSIEKEYASEYQGLPWVAGGFIDASRAVIDKKEKK